MLQTAGAPTLAIRYGAGVATLNWADSSTVFTLEGTVTPHLPSSWLALVGLPTLTNGTNAFSVPVTPAHQFYRLKSQ